MAKIRCYLAGAFVPFGEHSDWRDFVTGEVNDVLDFYDPRIDSHQGSIATFVSQDLNGVGSCDVVFYFMTNPGDVGAAIECERGNSTNKLVILCVNEGVDTVHPVLLGIARRVFIGIEAGVRYLSNLAKFGLENEFEAFYETLKN